jgi:hypothetical protein
VPTAPDTTLTATPKARAKSKTSTFAFTADRAGASFECSLDGGAFQPCVSPRTTKVRRGKHNFQVRALADGLTDASPASYGWKVVKKKKRRRK